MELVYKITKQEAALIGEFVYDGDIRFTPYCQETEDECYIITEQTYLLVQNRNEIKRVNFAVKQLVDIDTIIFKQINIQ
jgi:hypothetical protein